MSNIVALQLDLFTGRPRRGETAVIAMPREDQPTRERAMNANSLLAHERHADEFHGRKALILDVVRLSNRPMTDREILQRIKPDSDDMNFVRPRINELISARKLAVVCDVEDPVTRESVRTVWLV